MVLILFWLFYLLYLQIVISPSLLTEAETYGTFKFKPRVIKKHPATKYITGIMYFFILKLRINEDATEASNRKGVVPNPKNNIKVLPLIGEPALRELNKAM